jgi:hypothetical protein
MLMGTTAAWAEDEPAATAPVPPAPASTSGPMTPVQKEAPAAAKPSTPAIALPAEPPAAKKEEPPRHTAAPPAAAKPAETAKEAPPSGKPAAAAENAAKPPEKTAPRPKRPVARRIPEREQVTREDQRYGQAYSGAPQYQAYQRGYEETWHQSEGQVYRAPAQRYAPVPYEREEVEVWRAEPRPYRYGYAPPSYYREMPPRYGPYPGAPMPPPWGW